MGNIDFSDVTLTVKCTQCNEMSVQPIVELVGKDFATCTRCSGLIDLRDEVWQTAIRETLKRARQVKSKSPRQGD